MKIGVYIKKTYKIIEKPLSKKGVKIKKGRKYLDIPPKTNRFVGNLCCFKF